MVLRAFIGVPISEDVRAALAQEQARLRPTGARVGWVAPENIHITLVFLGDVFAAQLPALAAALDETAAEYAPFRVAAAGLGFFGSPRAPRVLWAGLRDPENRLAALQRRIAERVSALGLKLEDRAFHPHLTLGRVRASRGAAALTAAVGSANDTPYGGIGVDRVLLLQSHLQSQGVRYTVRHEAWLKGARHG